MFEQIEIYTAKRRAEFLLSNAVDAEEYARAREEVRVTGFDPDSIPHYVTSDTNTDRESDRLSFPGEEGAEG